MSLKHEEILTLCQANPKIIITHIETYETQISQLETRISQLEARIAELEARQKQNSRNSSKPPSTDIYKRPQSPRKKGERSPGGQKGHKGHTLTKVDVPDEIIVHALPICEGCGSSLELENPINVECRQVHDIPPPKIIVIEHRVETKRCPHCGRNNRAEFPPNVQYPMQYGQYLKALMVYLCIFQLLPYDRVSELFNDLFGRSLSKATLVKAVSECSQNLKGVEERIRELLVGAQVLNVDETGLRVVGIRQWLHVVSTELLTIYAHHRKRGSKATDAMQILPKFKGVMVHDFWSPYFNYLSLHAICNAHIIRELKGISDNYGQKWCDQLHDLIYEIKEAVDTTRQVSSSLDQQLKTDFEERYSRILEIGILENPVLPQLEPIAKRGRKKQSKAKNLLDRCQKCRTEILRFMNDFTIPFTNNLAERDLRMIKLQQKISGTFRSEEGATNFCRVRGYISTVRKHNLPVMSSIVGAFERSPFMPSAALKSP